MMKPFHKISLFHFFMYSMGGLVNISMFGWMLRDNDRYNRVNANKKRINNRV